MSADRMRLRVRVQNAVHVVSCACLYVCVFVHSHRTTVCTHAHRTQVREKGALRNSRRDVWCTDPNQWKMRYSEFLDVGTKLHVELLAVWWGGGRVIEGGKEMADRKVIVELPCPPIHRPAMRLVITGFFCTSVPFAFTRLGSSLLGAFNTGLIGTRLSGPSGPALYQHLAPPARLRRMLRRE